MQLNRWKILQKNNAKLIFIKVCRLSNIGGRFRQKTVLQYIKGVQYNIEIFPAHTRNFLNIFFDVFCFPIKLSAFPTFKCRFSTGFGRSFLEPKLCKSEGKLSWMLATVLTIYIRVSHFLGFQFFTIRQLSNGFL